jgi:hypothetical protein
MFLELDDQTCPPISPPAIIDSTPARGLRWALISLGRLGMRSFFFALLLFFVLSPSSAVEVNIDLTQQPSPTWVLRTGDLESMAVAGC